jgi:SIT4-associating protein SAP185/190
MHQKNPPAASAAATTTTSSSEEPARENGDSERREEMPDFSGSAFPAPLRNPFADDADEIDSDEEDDQGLDAETGWGSSGRGSWWRGVVMNRRGDGFGDHDSEDDVDEDEEDEEFGDFAMPEVDSGDGNGNTNSNNNSNSDNNSTNNFPGLKLVRPLAVHPPSSGTQKSAFGGLWPFTSPGFGSGNTKASTGEETEGGEAKKSAEEEKLVSETKPTVLGDEVKKEQEPASGVTDVKKHTGLDDTASEDEVVV